VRDENPQDFNIGEVCFGWTNQTPLRPISRRQMKGSF
jgi:hypothetical protein